jgi:signal transduction histidine kinase
MAERRFSWLPASLGGRLLAGAVLMVVLTIGLAGLVNAALLERFVRAQTDARLDGQIVAVTGALEALPGGALRIRGNIDAPPFDRPGRGWYWQVESAGRKLASPSLRGSILAVPADVPRPFLRDDRRPWPADLTGPRGERLIARIAERSGPDGAALRIIATAPREALHGPLRDMLLPLIVSMLVLAAILLAALALGLRLGLRPLERLRGELALVRSGRAARVNASAQPVEVAPLVAELNSLLSENEAGLERARRHVANLAHGLKTPLATLAITLAEPGRDADGALTSLVGRMDRLIRHHLARARSAALGGPSRSRTDLASCLQDMAAVMAQVHVGRSPILFRYDGPRGLAAACEPQDCDELFGNLLDNAFRHAHGSVLVRTEREGRNIAVRIDDDGAGLLETDLEDLLRPGLRHDESTPGYGFGLPIAREIAELYGGGLTLSRSELGGLMVRTVLPAALDVG